MDSSTDREIKKKIRKNEYVVKRNPHESLPFVDLSKVQRGYKFSRATIVFDVEERRNGRRKRRGEMLSELGEGEKGDDRNVRS